MLGRKEWRFRVVVCVGGVCGECWERGVGEYEEEVRRGMGRGGGRERADSVLEEEEEERGREELDLVRKAGIEQERRRESNDFTGILERLDGGQSYVC